MARSLTRALAVVAIALLAGCTTPKEQIQNASTKASIGAANALVALDNAEATGDVGPKAVPFVREARSNVRDVATAAASISDALPGVKNVESWYTTLMKRVAFGAICAIAFYFLWPVLPAVFAWFIVKFPKMLWMIPSAVKSAAKLDAEALASAPSGSAIRESVAVKRTKPLYNAAFVVAKRGIQQAG